MSMDDDELDAIRRRKLVDRLAYDVLITIAKTNPQMMKYARVK